MPIVPNFDVLQMPGVPSVVTITDTHTGTNVAITQRRVYLKDSLNNNILPIGNTLGYVQWSIAANSIDIDALTKDYALLITVDYLDVSNVVINTKSSYYPLTGYCDDFDYMLTQMLAVNPKNINNNSFFENKMVMANYVDSGNKALSRANDIVGAQICFDEATKLRLSKRYTFNINA